MCYPVCVNYLEISLLGLVLAMDATIYGFAYGLVLRRNRVVSALWLALTVGFYQFAMPLLGYRGGAAVRQLVAPAAPWIVLLVFGWLGLTTIRHAWSGQADEEAGSEPLSFHALMAVGIATSIDALAVGCCMAIGSIGGPMTLPQLLLACAIIGLITFICPTLSFHSARLLHHLPTKWLESAAGLLLIGLGVLNFFG